MAFQLTLKRKCASIGINKNQIGIQVIVYEEILCKELYKWDEDGRISAR